jgi:hypothetical protein
MTLTMKPAAKVASLVSLSVGSGGAGVLGVLSLHNPALVLPAVLLWSVTLITNAVVRVAESRYEHRASILKAESDGRTAEITTRAEAEERTLRAESDVLTSQKMTDARIESLRAGLDPATKDLAPEMLRWQIIAENDRLPASALPKLLARQEARNTNNKPRRGHGGVVVPIRPDD